MENALHQEVLQLLQDFQADAVVSSQMEYDFPCFEVRKSAIVPVLAHLKEKHGYRFLTTLCGIHFPEQGEKEFALMYQVHHLQANKRVRFKVFMPRNSMEVPTLTGVWDTANWMEREAFDFYGFRFNGHPDLRRIFNMDEMNYHPLRKEYGLEDATRDDKQDNYFGR
jgi:NADH-quinone oxidoreductase subunit C